MRNDFRLSDECPPAERILAAVENPRAAKGEFAEVVGHLLVCQECRAALAFVCAATEAQAERNRIEAVWRRFGAQFDELSATCDVVRHGSEACLDALAASAPPALALQASLPASDERFWRAMLVFPEEERRGALLHLSVRDGSGEAIAKGTFVLFDVEIPISGGEGDLPSGQLLKNHHKGGAAFIWEDGCRVNGAPTLNV